MRYENIFYEECNKTSLMLQMLNLSEPKKLNLGGTFGII